jgi:hypothetical protein
MKYGTYVNTASISWILPSLIRKASSRLIELGHFRKVFIVRPSVSRYSSNVLAWSKNPVATTMPRSSSTSE